MNKFFRYSGAKDKFLSTINQHIITDKDIYCEPFIGSGAVLFNLNKQFDKYYINDIDRNIIRIYRTFKNITYKDYIDTVNSVFEQFGRFTDDRRYISKESGENAKQNYYNSEIGLIKIIGKQILNLKAFIFICWLILVLIVC